MGGISSFEFVPTDYKIKYIDSLALESDSARGGKKAPKGTKTLKVMLSKNVIEEFYVDFNIADLTVGWLLSEVNRRYDHIYEQKLAKGNSDNLKKKLVIGLKTAEAIPALDYYLTQLENSLSPIKESTLLMVHYANTKDNHLSEKVNKNSFQYLKVIGCGGYSNVVLARKKDSGRMYAVKIIKKDKTYLKTNKSIYLNEANIMKKLNSLPFIVDLHYTFQTENELYFAMEPCIGGTLFHFMTHCAKGCINDNIVKFYVCEIIIALEKIHSKNIMYRDLKPENVLIDVDGHIKISDFGLSKQVRKRDETSMTFCGSPEYLPPEMLYGSQHSRLVDFYTLGCLIYEMKVGFPPFHCKDQKKLYKRIMTGTLRFPAEVDDDARDLISWLLAKNPEERPTDFAEIKQHPYFNDIHWGRIAKKEAIPPWVPDLYTLHAPKQISLNQVFHKNTVFKELHRTSQNARKKSSEEFKEEIKTPEHKSGRQQIEEKDKLQAPEEEILYLKDFDCEIESNEELCIRTQLESHLTRAEIPSQKIQSSMSIDTCNDIEEKASSKESPMKVVQEGSINSLMKYTKSVSTMKHKKRAHLRRFGSAEDPPESPLTRKHKEFYRQTFQEFNNLLPMSRTFTHQKPKSKAVQLDKL